MRNLMIALALAAFVGTGGVMVNGVDEASAKKAPAVKKTAKKAPAMDTKSGPAFKMVEGKLTKIDGDVYVLEDYEGNEVRMHVGKDTKKLTKVAKKPGDSVRAEVTRGYHANSIQ